MEATRRRAAPLAGGLLVLVLVFFAAVALVRECDAEEAAGDVRTRSRVGAELDGGGAKNVAAADDEIFDDAEVAPGFYGANADDDDDDEYEDEEEDFEGEEDDEDDEDDEDEDEDEDDEDEDFEDDLEGTGSGYREDVAGDEKDVVVLGSGNFSEFVKSNRYVLVEFYAPWCDFCRQFVPAYAETATFLKEDAVLAKVDAIDHESLGREFSISSYPTLYFFMDGVAKLYPGHRDKNEIIQWVRAKTQLTVTVLRSPEDAAAMYESQTSPLAVALLDSLEGSEEEEYTSAARQEDDVVFCQTDSAEVGAVFNISKDVKRPALVLLKREPQKVTWFDGPFKRDPIAAFATKNKLPLVITFSKETSKSIFESSIKRQVILFAEPADYEKLYPTYKEAAKSLIGELIFVHVDINDPDQGPAIAEFFGISGDKPEVMGFETKENGRKFLFTGEFTAPNLQAFGEDFLADRLKPFLKSAPIPETNDEDVKTVVGLNLDDVILDETKDAFLELYAPWCGHCQALEPIWKKLARRLKPVESIVIGKMDGTVNEHERAKSDGYPTLLFYPAGRKSFDPITFDGDRTVKDFIKFLKREAAIPFTVPKRSTEHNVTTTDAKSSVESKTSPGEADSKSESHSEQVLESPLEDLSFSSAKDEL